jgi:hypothetical protein
MFEMPKDITILRMGIVHAMTSGDLGEFPQI